MVSRRVCVGITIILTLFQSIQLHAGHPAAKHLQSIQIQTEDGLILRGLELSHEFQMKRRPIVLLHGICENTRVWRETAYFLFELGHPVILFNLRGHGQGSQRSQFPKHYRDAQLPARPFEFDRIVTYDIPAALLYTVRKYGQAPTLVGHSMGGMAARLALGGVERTDSGVQISSERIEMMRALSHSLITVGSPSSFLVNHILFRTWQATGSLSGPILEKVLGTLTRPKLSENSGLEGWGWGKFRAKTQKWIAEKTLHHPLVRLFTRGVVHAKNFDPKELGSVFVKGFNPIPTDLLEDVRRWDRQQYGSYDGRVDYRSVVPPADFPIFLAAGELDQLASSQELLGDFIQFQENPQARWLEMPNTSHLDLVAGNKAGKLLSEFFSQASESDPQEGVEFFLKNHPEIRHLRGQTVERLVCEKSMKKQTLNEGSSELLTVD